MSVFCELAELQEIINFIFNGQREKECRLPRPNQYQLPINVMSYPKPDTV